MKQTLIILGCAIAVVVILLVFKVIDFEYVTSNIPLFVGWVLAILAFLKQQQDATALKVAKAERDEAKERVTFLERNRSK